MKKKSIKRVLSFIVMCMIFVSSFSFLANAIKRAVDVPVIACNRINDVTSATDIIENGIADYVGIGRGLLADPYLPEKMKNPISTRCSVTSHETALNHLSFLCFL